MGSGHSKYLTNDEIKILTGSNPVLDRFYKKVKIDTIIPQQAFPSLFNNFLEAKILKRIILIAAENKDKLTKDEFDYIYSLFKTKNEEAKLNFILDFIFIKKNTMSIDKYIKKVKKYFAGSLVENMLLNINLLSNPKITDSKEVSRKVVYSIISNSMKTELAQIKFLANNCNNNNVNNRISFQIEQEKVAEQGTKQRDILVPANYIYDCNCQKKSNNVLLRNNPSSKNIRARELSKLDKTFKEYENAYGGIFPIKLLEKMLSELNVDPVIVTMTANYLHKKTEKSFINFELFKLGLTSLSTGKQKDSRRPQFEGLFDIMAFPKNYIKKNTLGFLMKSLGNEDIFNRIMNKNPNIDKIERDFFYDIANEVKDDILINFEKVEYIQYAFFNIIPEGISERMGTLRAMLNNQTLDEYAKHKALEEDEFYCIDSGFWEKIKAYLKEDSYSSSDSESSENEEKDVKKAKSKSLVIDTSKFSDKSGKIHSDAKYKSHYYIVPKKLYEILRSWYELIGADVNRKKIYLTNKGATSSKNKKSTANEYYSDSEDSGYDASITREESKSILSKSKSPITGIDAKNKLPFEIEVYPVFVQFYLYSNLVKKGTVDDIKNYLRENQNGKDSLFYPYSRKEKLLNILKGLRESVQNALNEDTARFWVYHSNTFEVCDINETLEKLGISGTALLILEIKTQAGKWLSDVHGNGNDIMNVTSDGLTANNISVGLENLGNSCYLNSILQTFLNNIDLRNIVFNNEGVFLNLMVQQQHDESTVNTKRSHRESNKKSQTVRPVALSINPILPETPGSLGKGSRGSTRKTSIRMRKSSMEHIKNVFNDKWIEFLTNSNNKNSNKKGQLFKEFISLMADKWYGKSSKLVPQKFKDICGEYNNDFNNNSQQDAHDFFNFLIDSLHEDTNLKQNSYKANISETPDTTVEDFANEYWADNFRNNVSIFHSLFLGQYIYKLKCCNCNYEKISFDTFTSLPLPIPEGKSLILEIVLVRLPFTMKSYYDQIHHLSCMNLSLKLSLKKIKSLASVHIPEELDSECSELIEEENGNNSNPNVNIKSKSKVQKLTLLSTTYYKEHKKNDMTTNENIVSNALNTQIPVRIKLEISKKEKCKKIIQMLKTMKDLDLEKKEDLTYFLITNNNKYVNEDLSIDECFESGQIAVVHELLNYKGIQKFYNNSALDFTPLNLTKNIIPYMVKLEENSPKKQESKRGLDSLNKQMNVKQEPIIIINPDTTRNYEIIVPIVHRSKYSKSYPEYYLTPSSYEELDTLQDYILLTTKNTMKIADLYDFIWEKYSYFLSSPSKYENNLWWRNKDLDKANKILRMKSKQNAGDSTPNIKIYSPPASNLGDNRSEEFQNLRYNNNMGSPTPKNGEFNMMMNNRNTPQNANNPPCKPFVLKILNKFTKVCAFCPWYNLCNGCILDPFSTSPLSCDYNQILVVEWCREIILNDLVENNLSLVLNTENALRYDTISSEASGKEEKVEKLENCLDLFTVSEDIKDFTCEKCKAKTTFKKKCELEKLPKYLVIALKRFKFTSLYSKKIESLINFPLEGLDLNKYVSSYSTSGNPRANIYDLFAVVNHIGTLEGGHYLSIVNHNGRWFKYDDSYVTETKDDIQTKWVYILIYKRKEENPLYFNYFGIIDTAYKIYMNQLNFENTFNFEIDQQTGRLIKENKGSSRFHYGEPVTSQEGKGFILNIFKDKDDYIVKIKLKKGVCFVKLKDEPNLKETIKDFASIADSMIPNVESGNKKCEKCIIF